MGFKYRDRQTIIADILRSTCSRKEGVRKTKILQSANLSLAMFNKYLNVLEANGYILIEEGVYRPTRKGHEFLENVRNNMLRDNMLRMTYK